MWRAHQFAQAGKAQIPVFEWHTFTAALAETAPWWEPGTRHGYHALTYGYLVGEVIRRVSGSSVGRFFRAEVAEPLGADFFIGVPASEDARAAETLPDPPPPYKGRLLENQ